MRKTLKIDPRLSIEKADDVFTTEPIVIRVNEFTEKSLEDFEEDMNKAVDSGQPVIPIVIDSFGGSAYSVQGMVASIESCDVPVATVLTTKAMSAGAILFMFGTDGYRFMHPEATMMIHDIGSITSGKIEEIKADANHMDNLNQRMYKRLSKRLGKPETFLGDLIKEHHHVDWFLTAKECKKLGVANHLRVPRFEVEISLTMKLT